MTSWAMIAMQLGLATAAIVLLRSYVWPQVPRAAMRGMAGLVLDVWAPLLLVLPMFFAVSRIEYSVRGEGWLLIAGPVVCGMLAVSLGMLVSRRDAPTDVPADDDRTTQAGAPGAPMTAAAMVAGVVLLLLGAAHIMSIWIGQVSFALAAVILWVNTPHQQDDDRHDAAQARLGWAMFGAMICAAGIGAASLWVDQQHWPLSALLIIGFVGIALTGAARQAGPRACMRIGIWAAAVGVLLGLGTISIVRMVPQVLRTISQIVLGVPIQVEPHAHLVAHGFGAYAIEAAVLVILPLMALTARRWPRYGRMCGGVLMLLASLLLVLWRVGSM